MYDIAIIGAGPAGASAAIFAARAGKKTLVFDSNQSVTRRAWVENHYGIDRITGPDLVDQGKQQARRFGATIVEAKVTGMERLSEGFALTTEDGRFEARHVLFATGLWTDLAEEVGLETKPATEPRIKTVIVVDQDGRTNIPGIWAAGTVAGTSVHTIITSGDGARVAVNIISELNGERWVDHDVLKPST
ncbi:FAD-dependent oxidoreductase [Alicyclobacillus shizuokensis]|uniref:FAD-dependent oxidoreductase n=1 Tax=Alicyclobacillus shizuokensis TaxID=392014 RepID=UPI0008326DDC|nr:FAD-dependent oxidoreductase [Alicyclobacillus shizuokensis]MCL6627367.1 FAD-dependent oxidoreductase [Alicyclobacillus shizuokensis]